MPSLAHHALVDLFREQPSLAPELLVRVHGLRLPRGVRYQLGDTNLDHLRPAERRADLVLELRRRGRPILILILEVQRRIDRRKRLAWIEYLVSARRRGRVCVLVITTCARVAAWAAKPFDLGPGNQSLHVWVLGPKHIEPVTDPGAARATPALALLSALVHARRRPTTIAAAVACLPSLTEELAELYYNLLSEHLPPQLRPYLERQMLNIADYNLPPSPLFKNLRRLAHDLGPDFFRRLLKDDIEAKANARAQELASAMAMKLAPEMAMKLAPEMAMKLAPEMAMKLAPEMAMKLADGEFLASRRKFLFRILHKAGITLSAVQRRRVERCVDPNRIDRWAERVFTAESAREVFAAPKKRSLTAAKKPAARTPVRKRSTTQTSTNKKQSAAPGRARR